LSSPLAERRETFGESLPSCDSEINRLDRTVEPQTKKVSLQLATAPRS
jgi:hypothetical protein